SASDADPAQSLAWAISTAAGHGTARVESGSPSTSGTPVVLSYQPTTAYAGTDSFVVQVSDGACGTARLTVNVTVTAPPAITPGGPVSTTVLQNGSGSVN